VSNLLDEHYELPQWVRLAGRTKEKAALTSGLHDGAIINYPG
jgi:hypothetical protein